MTTESAVTLEFMDQAERNTATRSGSIYNEDEIEELMVDEYRTSTIERPYDLQASYLSHSTET